MLEKLKESTQELQGLTDATPEEIFLDKRQLGGSSSCSSQEPRGAAQRKKSRFLREDPYHEASESSQAASRLANDILGLRNDSMGEYDRYRPEQQSRPAAATSSSSSRRFDFDDEVRLLPTKSSKFCEDDDDDTDALIQSLKQKTSRKHMSDILSELDRRETSPPVKFEPIPKFKDTFRPSPSPEPAAAAPRRFAGTAGTTNTLGRNKKLSSSSYASADGYGLESGGPTSYGGGRAGDSYYSAGGGGSPAGAGGQYGSLGRPQAKGYNQQFAQASYGQSKSNYSNNPGPSYGLQQPSVYGGPAANYGQDMYGPSGYGQPGYGQQAAFGQPSMQQRMPPTAAFGSGGGYGDQVYGQPPVAGGYGGPYGPAMGGMYSPPMGPGGPGGGGYDYSGQQPMGPSSRQQRHQMYNMGGGWQ
jgi:hypothetical protein